MTRRVPTVLAGLLAAILAGCGSTSVHHVTVTRTVPGPGTGTTTSTSTTVSSSRSQAAPAPGASLRGRSPQAILAAAARALSGVGGYAMTADLRQDGTRIRIALTSGGGRTFDAALADGSGVSEIINLPPRTFLRANRAFWKRSVGRSAAAQARAALLAGHWLRLSGASRRETLKSLGSLEPGTFARCLTEDNGTLRLAGRTRVDGTPALVIRDAGDRPGSTPGMFDVAAAGAPYPLRYTANGPTRRGGRIDACNDGRGGTALGTIALSRFGAIGPVQAPNGGGSGAGAGGGAVT